MPRNGRAPSRISRLVPLLWRDTDRARDGEHLAAEVGRPAGGAQRTAPLGGLDDHDRLRRAPR